MRRVIPFFVLVVAALGAGAYAMAGAPSQGGTAFALVDPNGGSPRLVGTHTNGFVGVSSPFPGDYCLTPGPGVDVVHTAAVASEEAFYSNALGFAIVRYPAPDGLRNCAESQLEVKTFVADNPPALSGEIAFAVVIP